MGTTRKALSNLALRDRVLLELDMTTALRPSELFALSVALFRWSRMQHERD
jgi:site-specific recombinase XerD